MTADVTIHERPAELLQRLLRFDTSNPPGCERECIHYVAELLRAAGIEATLVGRADDRPNLVARLPGAGSTPGLLMQGHVDVVPAGHDAWTHPPFSGTIADGCIWGRGALDMKGGVAMMLAAFIRAKAAGLVPSGDVVLAVLADEETGSAHGAEYLVEHHPELFDGLRFAIGEFGAFAMELGGRRLYPIMVAEKRLCWSRAIIRGSGGLSSLAPRGGTPARLADVLRRLDRGRLPVHVTPIVREMVEAIAAAFPAPVRRALRLVLNPRFTDRALDLAGARAARLDPLLHNTASPTMIRAGENINVVPSEIAVGIDGRLLPGFEPDDLFRELRDLLGQDLEFEVLRSDPTPREPDMTLFGTLSDILLEQDPRAVPIPMLLPGGSDGRFFARLGVQTYGFLPMQLPPRLNFFQLIHAADERIPVDSVEFGASAVYRLLERFGRATNRA